MPLGEEKTRTNNQNQEQPLPRNNSPTVEGGWDGLKGTSLYLGALLRSFLDVNLPKFTSDDLPLFRGIIGDLFPGVELPPSDYGPLVAKIEDIAVQRGLIAHERFSNKVIQLWETVMVRHGLMTV
eukprot:1108401-Amphidinium_carterae.1